MKKKLVLLMLSLFVMAGCGGIDSAFKDEPDLVAKLGVLEEQVANDSMKGTHILSGEADLAVRSLSLDLSDDKYLNNKLEVMGVMNENDDVFEITAVTVLEVLTESGDEVSFVEYKNNSLGFEMSYYNDWELKEGEARVDFDSPRASRVELTSKQFNYDHNSYDSPLKAIWVEDFGKNIDDFDMRVRQIGIDQLPSLKTEAEGRVSYYFFRGGFMYSLHFYPAADANEDELAFNEMLASFRFVVIEEDEEFVDEAESIVTESSSVEAVIPSDFDTELAVFESLALEFTGKYPADWYYAGSAGSAGVLRHYGFSDESVNDDNEIITLDVYAEEIEAAKIGKVLEGAGVSVNVNVDGRGYSFSGPRAYEDLMVVMADSISAAQQ